MGEGGRRSHPSRTAVITGAAGFIGSGLVRRLLHDDWTVVGVDSFDDFYDPELKRGNLAPFAADRRFSLLELDVRDTTMLRRGLDPDVTGDIDVVVHAAALTGVRHSWSRPVDYYDVNVGGTAAVLELMRIRSIPHLVFVSSSSVYGINPDVPWREEARPQPISVYAYTRMINGEPIRLFGDGTALRDLTYIDDVVAGLRAAMDYTGSPFEIFNLARNRPVELGHVIKALEQLLDVEATIDRRDVKRGDVPRTWGSIEKSRLELDYRPSTELTAGLEASLPWFHRLAEVGIAG